MDKASLRKQISTAMKAGDKLRVSTLRLILSELKNAEISKGEDLSEDEVEAVIAKEMKKRRESIEMYKQGGRAELVEKETAEMDILAAFLPEQMSEDELIRLVDDVVNATGAAGPRDIGKVMGMLMPKIRGKADGSLVSELVKSKLEETAPK